MAGCGRQPVGLASQGQTRAQAALLRDLDPPVESRRRPRVEDQLSSPRRQQRKLTDENAAIVSIHFDGALRQSSGKSAAAVYVQSYQCTYSWADTIEAATNQQAELIAATRAFHITKEIATKYPTKKYRIRGDSCHVTACVVSGRYIQYLRNHAANRLPNEALWKSLALAWQELLDGGIDVTIQWCARRFNREPDEMCNAAMDDREVDPQVKSIVEQKEYDEDSVERALEAAMDYALMVRIKAPRTLPRELAKSWRAFITNVLCDDSYSAKHKRQIFLLAPLLLSTEGQSISSRRDFKIMRSHITLLNSRDYLIETILRLPQVKQRGRNGECDEKTRIRVLARRGLFNKIVPDEEILIGDVENGTIKTKLVEMFPKRQLPTPLPITDSQYVHVSWADVSAAIRRLGKGKAPGLSSWTRETLMPLLDNEFPPLARNQVAQIVEDIANVHITQKEKQYLSTSVLMAFLYRTKPGKVRSITTRDTILKICWKITLESFHDLEVAPGSIYSRRAGCACACYIIQLALEAGKTVTSMDATNAFNEICREAIFEYLQSKVNVYSNSFAFLNWQYGEPTTLKTFSGDGRAVGIISVTTGTLQGCISGPWALQVGLTPTLRMFKGKILGVCDDLHIIDESVQKQSVVQALQKVKLRVNDKGGVLHPTRRRYDDSWSSHCAPTWPNQKPTAHNGIQPNPGQVEEKGAVDSQM